MNKLTQFINRLHDAGLSERQIDEAVYALNEYLNNKFEEEAQPSKEVDG